MPDVTGSAASLLQRWVRDRDEAAARQLILELHPLVSRIVHSHLARGQSAEDWLQEIYLTLFRHAPRYDPQRPLEHWVAKLSVNVCLKRLRTLRRKPLVNWTDLESGTAALLENAQPHLPPDPGLTHRAATETVELLMETLRPEERIVITLLHLEERGMEEVRALTGWSAVLIRVRAFRARRKMQAALAQLERPHP